MRTPMLARNGWYEFIIISIIIIILFTWPLPSLFWNQTSWMRYETMRLVQTSSHRIRLDLLELGFGLRAQPNRFDWHVV